MEQMYSFDRCNELSPIMTPALVRGETIFTCMGSSVRMPEFMRQKTKVTHTRLWVVKNANSGTQQSKRPSLDLPATTQRIGKDYCSRNKTKQKFHMAAKERLTPSESYLLRGLK